MTPRSTPSFEPPDQDPEVVVWEKRTAERHGFTEAEARFVISNATQREERRGKPGQPEVMWLLHGRSPGSDEVPGEILEVGIVPEWPEGVSPQASDPVRYRVVHVMRARSEVWRRRIELMEERKEREARRDD